MVRLAEAGMRAVAYDRRGHGRSEQPWGGYDFDTLADDLAAVLETLDLNEVTLVGHSTGTAEIVRYLARHGSDRVARIAGSGLRVYENASHGLHLTHMDQLSADLLEFIKK